MRQIVTSGNSTKIKTPDITTFAPWFGSNRMLADKVGKALEGCSWVGIPFAGGMPELRVIKARTIVANDLHRHVINLARIVADDELKMLLVDRLEKKLFHPDYLKQAQEFCRHVDQERGARSLFDQDALLIDPVDWAEAYFVSCWMSLSARAGTKGEFKGPPATRWDAGGGDSAKRYWSAVEALEFWNRLFRRVNFQTLDCFEFLRRCKDLPKSGIYCDAPFPGSGDKYVHTLTLKQHSQLAMELSTFHKARVVCRFYDTDHIREWYPQEHWTWHHFEGRKQTNAPGPEVLLVRNAA